MVDFQSRDTSRSLDEDDEDDEGDGAVREDGEAGGNGEDGVEGASTGEGGTASGPEVATAEDAGGAGSAPGLAVVAIGADSGLEDDAAVTAVVEDLSAAGFAVASRESIDATFDNVQSGVDSIVRRDDVDLVVTVGGVGVGPRDVTVEAVEPLFDMTIPGVGEVVRDLARDRVGTAAVAVRTTAGVTDAVPVVCLPGDPSLVELATGDLLVPEAASLVEAVGPGPDGADGVESEESAGG